MRLASVCFIAGASAGLAGMSLGIVMGISQDFALTPVHAHINLLGFVSLMLYGLYYRGSSRSRRLAAIQVAMALLGFPAMTGGLAMLLMSQHASGIAEILTIAGSLLTIAALALFLLILVRDTLQEKGHTT